jgi:hypothetical protein
MTTTSDDVRLLARQAASAHPRRGLREVLRENGLLIVMALLFVGSCVGQVWAGKLAFNESLIEHRVPPVDLLTYLTSGHFLEAVFENWESEFLQMALFVVLTIGLRQKGSSESKQLEGEEAVDEDPRKHRLDPGAPWPVRRGGVVLAVYEHSLSIALFLLFAACFAMHAVTGVRKLNQEAMIHGMPQEGVLAYVGSSDFWFESFQNWQSEFLSIVAIVALSIWLRQRGSPQSKPVAAPHEQTGC